MMFSRARTEKDCVCDVHERTCLAELLKPTISFSYLSVIYFTIYVFLWSTYFFLWESGFFSTYQW